MAGCKSVGRSVCASTAYHAAHRAAVRLLLITPAKAKDSLARCNNMLEQKARKKCSKG